MRTKRLAAVLALALGALPLRAADDAAAPVPSEAAAAPAPEPGAVQDERLQQAVRELEAGEWRLARKRAKQVLSADKKAKDAWLIWGRACIAAGQYRKAVRRFNKALKRDPHYAPAYYWKAKAFEAWGRLDEAANEYQAAFHADPKLEAAKNAWRRLRDQASVPDQGDE
jgi:Tfp pilus assembly protein PilF